ncbi:14476_t:CDS:2 [Acaulospora morrowiae]|uniref:Ornithine decarboxylase antizyme n=1 Tax=Acaulospora morrowiae TaxID=94023 RepID=A0A9N8ZA59_9GLOM|nr:14476_t:CDS:2 [Acaulospora morrowiae]
MNLNLAELNFSQFRNEIPLLLARGNTSIILPWERRLDGIPDMTPEFFLNLGEHILAFDKTSSFTKKFFRGVPAKVDQVNIISLHDPQNCIWEGFVMDGIFFLEGNIELKERMVSIIELAEESLKCNSLVVCLDKKLPNISTFIRDFLYVGFELVWPGTIDHNTNEYILVGMEL